MGTSKAVKVDVRVVAATNRDLERMIADGQFREDLYYRLNVIQVSLPPLRERPDDLIELVFHFINRSSERTGKEIKRIEPEALAVLERYPWPGNIRELENTIERAVVLADGDSITLRDLPTEMMNAQPFVRVASTPTQLLPPPSPASPPSQPVVSSPGTDRVVSERELLASALQATGGNKAEAARRLGMPRSTFYSKLKKHQL